MKDVLKLFGLIAMVAVIGFAFITCDDGSGSVTSTPTVSVISYNTTLGLAYTLIDNGTAYSVSRGTATATVVVIPAEYNELPVREIAPASYKNNSWRGGFVGYETMTSVTIPNLQDYTVLFKFLQKC